MLYMQAVMMSELLVAHSPQKPHHVFEKPSSDRTSMSKTVVMLLCAHADQSS